MHNGGYTEFESDDFFLLLVPDELSRRFSDKARENWLVERFLVACSLPWPLIIDIFTWKYMKYKYIIASISIRNFLKENYFSFSTGFFFMSPTICHLRSLVGLMDQINFVEFWRTAIITRVLQTGLHLSGVEPQQKREQ